MEKFKSALELKRYWDSQYEDRFEKHYKSESFSKDMFLLKRLVNEYDKYLLLESVDMFFKDLRPSFATISFYASKKVFTNKFSELIKCQPIIKYRRMFPYYDHSIQSNIKSLVQEYSDYCSWERISDDEKLRRVKIIEELEEIINGAKSEGN